MGFACKIAVRSVQIQAIVRQGIMAKSLLFNDFGLEPPQCIPRPQRQNTRQQRPAHA